jgi:hypothetical protein
MTLLRTTYENNHFKIFARTLPDEYRLFEFEFSDYDEFMSNPSVKRTIDRYTDFERLTLLQNSRSWITEYGKKTKTFYTAVMERNRGKNWHVFGAFDKDVPELPRFDKKDIYYEVAI